MIMIFASASTNSLEYNAGEIVVDVGGKNAERDLRSTTKYELIKSLNNIVKAEQFRFKRSY